MPINYYDANSVLSCKIKGTIYLEKTSIPTNLILSVHFENSMETNSFLTAD